MFSQVKIVEVSKVRAFNPKKVCAVDQFLAKDFNYNDCGWLRNDLSALVAAQTKEQYEAILSRLTEIKPASNLPDGVKLKDAFNLIRPRYVQTENEFADFAEQLAKGQLQASEAAAYESLRSKGQSGVNGEAGVAGQSSAAAPAAGPAVAPVS